MTVVSPVSASNSLSRHSLWPTISSYYDMPLHRLSTEIALMRKDLEYYKSRNDEKSHRLAVEAYNRLNVLFQLYSEKSGRPLETVRDMYGNPTLY